jgi:hypothetical protein
MAAPGIVRFAAFLPGTRPEYLRKEGSVYIGVGTLVLILILLVILL